VSVVVRVSARVQMLALLDQENFFDLFVIIVEAMDADDESVRFVIVLHAMMKLRMRCAVQCVVIVVIGIVILYAGE
jgi:hypothetical protein